MQSSELEKEFEEAISEDALVLMIFSMAQDLVQTKKENAKDLKALNMIVGASFALYHAIEYYKEVKHGKSIKYSSRIANSENGSRLS